MLLVTEARVCEQLAQGLLTESGTTGSRTRGLLSRKSNALTITLPGRTVHPVAAIVLSSLSSPVPNFLLYVHVACRQGRLRHINDGANAP